jgi:hypothetical protein
MTTISAGAQLSEDGDYWWDGAEWQPVTGGGGGGTDTEVGQLSSAASAALVVEIGSVAGAPLARAGV